jgi:hypothetical protein
MILASQSGTDDGQPDFRIWDEEILVRENAHTNGCQTGIPDEFPSFHNASSLNEGGRYDFSIKQMNDLKFYLSENDEVICITSRRYPGFL